MLRVAFLFSLSCGLAAFIFPLGDKLTGAIMWNVKYKYNGIPRLYLTFNVSKPAAEKYAKVLADKYVGKPYPNGKGFYPVTDVEVITV